MPLPWQPSSESYAQVSFTCSRLVVVKSAQRVSLTVRRVDNLPTPLRVRISTKDASARYAEAHALTAQTRAARIRVHAVGSLGARGWARPACALPLARNRVSLRY